MYICVLKSIVTYSWFPVGGVLRWYRCWLVFQVLTMILIFAACSTVLLPTRIVHALNLNVEDISSQPSTQCGLLHNYRGEVWFPLCFVLDFLHYMRNKLDLLNKCFVTDALTSAPGVPSTSNYVGRSVDYCSLPARNGFSEYQKKPCYPVSSQIQTASSEISLPQEWTY